MAENVLHLSNFIGGRFVPHNDYINSYNPATGRVWARVPNSGPKEIDAAVQCAKEAFPIWSGFSPKQRSDIMLKIADLLEERLDEFALAESMDQGKTLVQAKTIEIPRAVVNMRHFGTSILFRLDKSKLQEEIGVLNYTVRQPVGIAGLISPWNLPLYLLTFKIAPAIATGNTVVCKPSEMTSVTAWKFCKLCQEAGLPPGVINMVFGNGPMAGEALVKHPDVAIISFTGSTLTGQRIYQQAAQNYKKLSLEMGGKNAGIIFDDADLVQCIPACIRSSFLNQGEICLCTSLLYVQRKTYNRFVQEFIKETGKLKVGSPLDVDTFMGALVSREHLAKVQHFVELARSEGATISTGRKETTLGLPADYENGYFMLPVVITDVKSTSICMTEEIFGPVVCIAPFDSEEDVIEMANSSKYGLCASAWSNDVSRIHRVAHKLKVGTVWSNCWMIRCLDMPFGGCKHSGLGREGTEESLELFTELKTICLKYV